ncbi:uncharacterized protein LOC125229114 [Leguminivora glycinivorella]|uniref:uncharacterized protein LOC125229114 n=1 Tax=Leguminivora glycinivorella TaxID=1035111 RepID=UPI00200D7753|nr:uncharacterized protein LOC125229114 [Leguminivora glycinivorella]
MAGLIKAALLFKILVVQGSVFHAKNYLKSSNHVERYESTYSEYSDDFGNALNFDVGEKFIPRFKHNRVGNRKLIPDWFRKPELMGPVGYSPIGSVPHWPSPNGQGRIGFPARRNPDSNRRNRLCQNIKGLPTPESGCCGVEATRFPIQDQYPGYPNGPLWAGLFNDRHRRSTDSNEPPHKMIRGRIERGRATDLHQLPWTVRLAINPRLKGLHSPDYCGGTIISSRYVLTAAHCLHNTFKDISQLEVFLAEYDTNTYPEDCITGNGKKDCIHNIVKKVEHVIIHKDYNDTYLQNDVALLRLSSDIPYTDFIRPICLPSQDIADVNGENIIIAGWGLDGKKETNLKQAANVNYVSNVKCKEQYSYKDDSMFCSIGDHGEDICHGDSGGPLMVLSENKYFLSGVVSGKRGDHECGSSVSSLFNNVFFHKDWIVEHESGSFFLKPSLYNSFRLKHRVQLVDNLSKERSKYWSWLIGEKLSIMVQLTLSLAVVVLSVLGPAFAGAGGGRPGFGQVGFGDGTCSAIQGILPDTKSGCCGKHAEGGGSDDNNDGGDQEDNNNGPDGDDGNGPVGGDGNDLGPIGGGYGPGGDGDFDFGHGNDFDFGHGKDFDFGHGNDFDFGKGIDFDFGNRDWIPNDWGLGGNGIGDSDFGRNMFNGENRFKRSTDKNASDISPDKYIIAGKPAGILQYPWLVHLNVKLQDKIVGCGGSLISSRHVITAAHCVDFQIGSYEDVSVYLAEYNTRTFPTDCVGRQCVKNMVIHPDRIAKHPRYNRDELHNDIAMMRLSSAAPYTDYIRPICVPRFNINSGKFEGTPLTVAGWGQTESGQPSTIKLHTQVAQVPLNKCRRHYPDITEGQLCAAGKNGQDTCMGDSGGPIMMERDGIFYLIGLVSGKRSDAGCGSPVPTMYTNVFAYTKWIQDFMRK